MLERRRRRPRQVATVKKHVHLTPEAVALVETFAARQDTSFSGALETLARLGARQAPPDAYAAVLEAAVRGAAREELGRQTALMASASVDAHAAYVLALQLVTKGQAADQAQKTRQEARAEARRIVRWRASAQGREELAALLTAPEPGEEA
jgi:hypothetical protein